MTNATLRGKPDAGNPHVRFDEGEVASAKPRRGSLLYKNLLGMALTLVAIQMSVAATWYVAPEGDDGNDGTGWNSPLATPNAAVMKSGNGDMILLSNGVYRLTKMIWIGPMPSGNGWEVLPEGKSVQDLKIVGLSDNPEDVVLDGQGSVACFYCRCRVQVRNLTVRNGLGSVDAYGYRQGVPGGLMIANGGSMVSNCIVQTCVNRVCDGSGALGGGLSIVGPSSFVYDTLVEDCIVSNCITSAAANKNGAELGGGGAQLRSGAVASNCVFRNNFVVQDGEQGYEAYTRGGGVELQGSKLFSCKIYGNSVTNLHQKIAGCGGGVAALNGSWVEDCLIYGNSASCGGGGVYLAQTKSSNDDNGVLRACTITNNTVYVQVVSGASGRGSGVLANGKNDLIEHCLIGENTFVAQSTGNRAYEGGGLGIGYTNDSNTSNVVVRDCLIINNRSPNCGGIKIFRSHDIVVSNCVIRGNVATVGTYGAYSSEGLDGGLFADCWFLDNKATTYGAWLGHANYGAGPFKPVYIRNSFVAGNTSKTAGTYITTYQHYLPLCIENCTIVSNNFESTRSGFVTGNPWATTAYIPNTYSNLFVDSCVVLYNGNQQTRYNGIYDFSIVSLDLEKAYAGDNFNMTLLPTNVRRTVTSSTAKIAFTEENGNIGVSYQDLSLFRNAAAGDFRPAAITSPMVAAAKATPQPWMAKSVGARDMGDGSYTVSVVGKYGVTIARNNANPRLNSIGRPAYGCFEWLLPPGFSLYLR